MRAKSPLVWILAPVVGYLTVLLLIAAFVAKPSPLGWVGFGVASAIGLLIAGVASALFPRVRANAVRLHPRTDGPFRLLVVADSHCESASLCAAVSSKIAGSTADVFIVAAVLASPLHFLADDEERQRDDARVRLSEALRALTRLGIEARGVVGSDDPLQAIGDALAGFPANEILFAAPMPRQRIWLEHDLERKARDLFGVHISSLTVDADTASASRRWGRPTPSALAAPAGGNWVRSSPNATSAHLPMQPHAGGEIVEASREEVFHGTAERLATGPGSTDSGVSCEGGARAIGRLLMPYAPITKPTRWKVVPNLRDYEGECTADFWGRARRELDGLPGGRGLNIAHEAVDRHAAGALRDHLALRWLGKRGEVRNYSYGDLASLTNRFANVLAGLGLGKGDMVCVLAGRIPELYIAALGTLKNRSVFCPLFSAFGPEPIHTRLAIGKAKALVTTETLYERKVAGLRLSLPELEHVILVGDDHAPTSVAGTVDYQRLMLSAADEFTIGPTASGDPAVVHFTSGTTGAPKGAVHVHEAIVAHHITGKLALDLHADDVFWCTADPGWVTGSSYGIFSPLTNGVTSIVDEGDFDAERWYGILDEQRVTVWYTAPTAIRMMMKAGAELARAHDLPQLRFLASVGEPLNPEGVLFGEEAFGLPFHDNWWQTETGAIMIANFPALEIRPGSMGRPFPGIEPALVHRLKSGGVELVEEPGAQGEIALRPGWPSMFRAYLGDPERYEKCFRGGWYLTGDLARRDADGYFWFVGRADDVIKTSGHLIGPFEVESVLLEHPAVAEAGVIGKPDPVAGEIVKAFVTLKEGYEPSHELERELLAHARVRLGAVVAPKEIEFAPTVPHTRSGKIMRRLLKARELGLPEGDVSTVEGEG